MGVCQKSRGFSFKDSECHDMDELQEQFEPLLQNRNDVLRVCLRLTKHFVSMHGTVEAIALALSPEGGCYRSGDRLKGAKATARRGQD